jgi:hypothetical protein
MGPLSSHRVSCPQMRFGLIYFAFLVGFSQLLYIASFEQNKGLTGFGEALKIGFQPVVQGVPFPPSCSVARYSHSWSSSLRVNRSCG